MTKKALLVGINYLKTDYQLSGCANDIISMRDVLKKNNFSEISMISDDYKSADFYPSKTNIITQLKHLISTAKQGDILFFHYSGHGTYTRDTDQDETDDQDEAICPASGGDILDDELKRILNTLPLGVKLFALMDCCHSGSMFDLENNLDKKETKKPYDSPHGYAVMISGCQDNETSADALIKNRYQGALTASFLKEVTKRGFNSLLNICFSNSISTMKELRNSMFDWLTKHNYLQKPNIAFEGTFTNSPILHSFQVRNYELRKVPARENKEYPIVSRRYQKLGL